MLNRSLLSIANWFIASFLPCAALPHPATIANIDEKVQAGDAKGNTFSAAMLRGNYAGEIGLVIAMLPQ